MKNPIEQKEDSVSEIIGTLLIFSILVTLFSSFILWYVPFSGQQYESQYDTATQNSLSSLANQLSSPSLQNNSMVTQNIPMGIQNNLFGTPSSTNLAFSSGFNISLHYSVSIDLTYSGNTPTNQISNSITGVIPVGNQPDGVAVDTVNNLIFVLNSNYSSATPGNISVFSGATSQNVGNIPLLGYPTGITFDPQNNLVFVTEGNITSGLTKGFVQVINGETLTVTKTLYYSSLPYDITYIPYLNQVMLTTQFSSASGGGGAAVSLNATNFAVTAYIQVAPPSSSSSYIIPSSISYNPANGYVYVALGNVTGYDLGIGIINPITNQVIGEIPCSSPWSLAYDTSNGFIFATQSELGSNNEPLSYSSSTNIRTVFVANGINNAVIKSYSSQFDTPVSLVFDSANHLVYVADFQNDSVYVFDGSNGAYLGYISNYNSNGQGKGPGNGPNAMAWDPINGEIYVPNYLSDTLTIISGSTTVSGSSSLIKGFSPVNTLRGKGEIVAYGSTPFTTQNYYRLQDGFVVQSSSSYGQSLNGLPVVFNHHAGLVTLSSKIENYTGAYSSVSSSGNLILSAAVKSVNRQVWNTGEVLNFVSGGIEYSATVTAIVLNGLTLSINSSAIPAWNYSLFSYYNATHLSYNSNPSGTSWFFSGLPVQVTVSNRNLILSTTSSITLLSFQYQYFDITMNM